MRIYEDTQLRREFVDPLFEELGCDVQNKKGYAEAYKDVIHEDAIKVGGATNFTDVLSNVCGLLKPQQPLVTALDDSLMRKCGIRLLSRKYHKNENGSYWSFRRLVRSGSSRLLQPFPYQ